MQDFLEQKVHVSALEWIPQGRELVQHTAEAPNVRLVIVLFLHTDLRREVVSTAHEHVSKDAYGVPMAVAAHSSV